MSLVGLVLVVLVLCVVVWAIQQLAAAFALPPQIKTVIIVLVVLLFTLWLVGELGGLTGGPILRIR
jgi:hypothetical protein